MGSKLFDWFMNACAVAGMTFMMGTLVVIFSIFLSGCTDHEAEWQAYRAQHACKIIDRKPGRSSMTTMITNNGVQVIPYNESGISIYQCDNGTISHRED